jgi:O-antigen ligase
MQTRNSRRAALFGLVGVMAVVLVLGGVIRPETYYRFFEYSVFRMTSVLGVDQSIAGRLALISESLTGGLQHFLLGRGVGGSAEILQGSYPHNYILEAFLDGGLFAMMALIAFSAGAILQPLRYVPRDQRWVIALALFITGAFLKSFSIYESWMLFFTLGYLFGYYAYRSQRRYSNIVNRSKTVAFR